MIEPNKKNTIKKIFFNKIVSASIFCLLISCQSRNISCNADSKADIIEELKSEMARQQMTSISFAVFKNENLILNSALGYADINTGRKATTQTRYLVASISKTITCTALMQLYEQNLFSLDDDINDFLPFTVRNPSYPNDKITIRMLLAHYSSISDEYQNKLDLYCYGYDCPMSLEEYFDNIFSPGGKYLSRENFSKHRPGTTADYSNLAMALAGYLAERISKQPFDAYCKDHIFLPLGMTRSEWRLSNIPQTELAIPYSDYLTSSNPQYTFPDYPDGGLRTTAEDLSKFLMAFAIDGRYNNTQILQPATVDLMKTLQFGSDEQALAFYYITINGNRVIGHNGSEMGVTTEMYLDPIRKTGVIILNNNDETNLERSLSLLFNYANNY